MCPTYLRASGWFAARQAQEVLIAGGHADIAGEGHGSAFQPLSHAQEPHKPGSALLSCASLVLTLTVAPAQGGPVMTPAQVRMARAALSWSLTDLAQASGVDPDTISAIEAGGPAGPPEALAAIGAALEAAGIIFLDEDGKSPGVRLRKGQGAEVGTATRGMLLTLQEGRTALQAELEMLADAPRLERVLLQRLRGSAAEFGGQASFLVATLERRHEDQDLVSQAKQLLSFFQLVKDQFASLLEGGWAGPTEKAADEAEV
jgi:transcriptional regulator with XRE-family HTH domain